MVIGGERPPLVHLSARERELAEDLARRAPREVLYRLAALEPGKVDTVVAEALHFTPRPVL